MIEIDLIKTNLHGVEVIERAVKQRGVRQRCDKRTVILRASDEDALRISR
jgi:hypothetical protein